MEKYSQRLLKTCLTPLRHHPSEAPLKKYMLKHPTINPHHIFSAQGSFPPKHTRHSHAVGAILLTFLEHYSFKYKQREHTTLPLL